MMYQQVTLIGYLGNDPVMRYTPAGEPVTNMRLAVTRRWTREDGQVQEKTTWFNVTFWRQQAEVANQYLSKGRRVLIIGEIEGARPYTDREGNQRASIDIQGREIRFLDSNRPEQEIATTTETTPINGSVALADEALPF